jgi:hypothetical protein
VHEHLKKKGISLDGNTAEVKVKRVETSRYLDQTQAYEIANIEADVQHLCQGMEQC